MVHIDRFSNTTFGKHLEMLAHPVFVIGIVSERPLQRRLNRDRHGVKPNSAGVVALMCYIETCATDATKHWQPHSFCEAFADLAALRQEQHVSGVPSVRSCFAAWTKRLFVQVML